MKILFISELFWPYVGGAERLGARLVADLDGQGHRVLVVTSHDQLRLPDHEGFRGVPVFRFGFREALKRGDVGAVLGLRRRFRDVVGDFAPELIHLYQPGPSALCQWDVLGSRSVPLLVTLHNDLNPGQMREKNSVYFRLFHAATWLASCSRSALGQALALDPSLTSRSSVIHNGVDVPDVMAAPYPEYVMQLLCLGRLVAQKGFDLALRAFAEVSPRFPDARLVIAGDGEERDRLEAMANDLGLNRVTDFPGLVAPERVAALMNQSRMVLMPSRREGLPVAALETACAARPIIASRVGGLPELVVHNETGLLFEKEDVGELARSVVRLLTQPALAARLGLAARKRVESHFSWRKYVDEYLALYRRLHRTAPCPSS